MTSLQLVLENFFFLSHQLWNSRLLSFIPGRLTFCNYKLHTRPLWSGRCAAQMSHVGRELFPDIIQIFSHLFPSTVFFRVTHGAGVDPRTCWAACTKKKFKHDVSYKPNIQLKSYSWNVRTKKGVTAFLTLTWGNMFSPGNLESDCPQGTKMRAGK